MTESGDIQLQRVTKRFGPTVAVQAIDLTIPHGSYCCLLGPSGCGKTTILRMIAGHEEPTDGRVLIGGDDVTGLPPVRRGTAMMFQSYALFPHMTVVDNVAYNLRMRGVGKAERRQQARAMLARVHLDAFAERVPAQLSGGQQQRVALARALAPAPRVVLLDEPWSNVDPQLRTELRTEVSAVLRPLRVTAILVTHDREEAFSVADRIALMRDGSIVQVGTPEELYFAPVDRWAAEFLGAGNVLAGEAEQGFARTPIGAVPTNGAAGAVELLVRPELVGLEPHPQGDGEVVGREFRGHDVFYRVRVNGLELVSQRPSNEVVPLGARVAVTLHDGRVAVLG